MLSIVIPTKNEEQFLPILLKSIRSQTLQPSEIIVADAHSTDGTREVALEFGASIIDGGMPGVGRNRGAKIATGNILLFLDADVELRDPYFLEKNLARMGERGLDIATCDAVPIAESAVDRFMHEAYNIYVRFWGARLPHAPGFCIFVKRELHEQIGGFDETVTFCEDHDYARRAAKIARFGLLDVCPIPVSVRRLDRDGRLQIAVKFALAEIHLLFAPIRHNGFKYSFGHGKKVAEVTKVTDVTER